MTQTAEISYGGMSTSPDYKQSKDGDAALLVNMECTPYGLRPSQVCDTPVIEREGFSALYLHRLPESEQCTIIGLQSDNQGGYTLTAIPCDKPEGSVSLNKQVRVNKLSELDNWSCIGNVVSFTHNRQLKYLVYTNGSYRVVNRLPSYFGIEFACQRVLGNFKHPDYTDQGGLTPTNRDRSEYRATMIGGLPSGIAKVDIMVGHDYTGVGDSGTFDPYYVPDKSYFKESNLKADDAIFGVLNSGLDISRERGEFVFPRIVRYALKLNTGNQYLQYSPPILLFPREDMIEITGLGDAKGTFAWNRENGIRIYCECWKPMMKFIGGIAKMEAFVNEWKDLIEGIDIYLSAPIYTINTEHVLAKRVRRSEGVVTVPYFAQNRNFSHIPELSEMYLVRQIPIGELADTFRSMKWEALLTKEDLPKLKTLQNRPAMPTNSYANKAIDAGVVYAANSRFVIGDVTETLPSLYPLQQMTPPVLDLEGKVQNNRVDINNFEHPEELSQSGMYKPLPFALSHEGKQIENALKIKGFHPGGGTYGISEQAIKGLSWFPVYYSYPDLHAEALLTHSWYSDGSQHEYWQIPFKASQWNEGSYIFALKDDPNVGAHIISHEIYSSLAAHGQQRRHPNTIKMGDVGSPLFFTDGNSLQVGSGRITAIASNSHEVSQGMYGQYNLVAFATDGISVLTLRGDGSLDSPVSIGTDVVKGMNQVGNIDTTIVAVADTGVIAVSGSRVEHLLSYFPGMDEDWKKNVHLMKVIEKQFLGLPDIQPMETYFSDAIPIYDSRHDRMFVFNPKHPYSYVLNIQSKMWSINTLSIERRINAPGRCLVVSGDSLYDLSKDGNPLKGLYISRAIKIGSPHVAKRIFNIHQRGTAVNKRNFSGKVLLYSNAKSDYIDTPIASGEGYKLHSYGISWPAELHRLIVFVPTWPNVESVLSGCSISHQHYLNRPYP